GWTEPSTADRFAAFCGRVAGELAPVLRRACTINEPNCVSTIGHLMGVWPPGARDGDLRRRVNGIFCDAPRKAVEAIRKAAPGVPVGLTLSMADFQAVGGPDAEARRDRIRYRMEDEFLEATEGDDFVGVQTYTRERV